MPQTAPATPNPAPADRPLPDLSSYPMLASADPVKVDLELVHEDCGRVLCDVQDGETMDVLLVCVRAHAAGCRA